MLKNNTMKVREMKSLSDENKERYKYFGDSDGSNYDEIIESLVLYYDGRCKFYKKLYYIFVGSRTVLTALIPVLTVIELPFLNIGMATLLSSGALIAESFLAISHAHDKWKSYRRTCDHLCSEHRLYCTAAGKYCGLKPEERFQLFVLSCEEIIKEEGLRWEEYMEQIKDIKPDK